MAYTPVPLVALGDLWSAGNHNLYIRDNFAAGVPDIFTTAGDMVYGTGADAAARLPIGGRNRFLRVNNTATSMEWGRIIVAFVQRIGSGQSIPDITYTAASYDGSPFDTGTFWNAGQPTRLTVPRDGAYLIGGKIAWEVNSTGVREIRIHKNGTWLRTSGGSAPGLAGVITKMDIVTLYEAVAGDYFELFLWQNSGVALLQGGGTDYSAFWITELGPIA